MTYRDAVSRLYSLEFAGVKLGLANITRLCLDIGNPEKQFVSVHVAGTNGKGSVCAMLDSMLRAAGYRVGRFTSPHLRDFRERIQLDGRPITRERVTRFVERYWSLIKRGEYSFFEATTALAFETFAKERVDIAVVEVGLGGRLDATTILPASLSIITNIAPDHERLLGRTPRQIAREKAGIVRPGVPLLLGPLIDDARDTIVRVASRRRAPFWDAHEILNGHQSPVSIPAPGEKYQLALPGRHQATNAATALAAAALLTTLEYQIPSASARLGLRTVHWPARFQVIKGRPTVVYDAAHNKDSVAATAATWCRLFGSRRAVTVFTARADKDYRAMASSLKPHMSQWIGCPMPTVAGIERSDMEELALTLGVPFTWVQSPRNAMRKARQFAGPSGVILVVGSHFLIGEIISARLVASAAPAVPLTAVSRIDLLAAARTAGNPFA